ncbi:MAG: TIGR00282 family metallophosphoesterase [Spirochaetes bacterium]|nr:TIGR00282 family metallophosphoesterase [Spirochaetota bacterium]
MINDPKLENDFNVLFLGDIIGRSGRECIENGLAPILQEHRIDFVIANGENAAGGFGINSKIAYHFLENGIDCITTGNHIWKNKDILEVLDKEKRILRPANYPAGSPGRGYSIYKRGNKKILVINLLGRLNLLEVDCPFQKANEILEAIDKNSFDISIVDFHAEVTSEKVAMGWFLDGRVSAVIGTHTHVQTADERILYNGTAYITDAGMTGSFNSVIGMEKESIINHFLTRMPKKFQVASGDEKINGVVVSISDQNKARAIYRINHLV